jgi:hypothetical protein
MEEQEQARKQKNAALGRPSWCSVHVSFSTFNACDDDRSSNGMEIVASSSQLMTDRATAEVEISCPASSSLYSTRSMCKRGGRVENIHSTACTRALPCARARTPLDLVFFFTDDDGSSDGAAGQCALHLQPCVVRTCCLTGRDTPYHSHSRTYSSPCIYVRQRRRVVMHTTRPLEAPPRMYTSVAAESIRLADGCCWFILRGKYCRLIADDRFILTEKYLQLRRRRRCTLGRGVSGAASTGPRPRDPPDGDTPSPRRAPACVRALLSASPTHTMHARVKSLSLGLHTLYLSG